MENLLAVMESDLKDTIEGEFGVTAIIVYADGTEQTKSVNDPTLDLKAQVRYFSQEMNPETGEIVVVQKATANFRRTSLDQIPEAGETVYIRIPISPQVGAVVKEFVATATRSPEGNTDIGTIIFSLQRPTQS